MSGLYLTSASISYFTQFLLTLIVTVFLIIRSFRYQKYISRQNGYLLAFFLSLSLLSLLFFLEYSLLPAERLVPFNLENVVVAILLVPLIHFAYSYPGQSDRQKLERRVILFTSCAYFLFELEEALRILFLLRQGHLVVRLDFLQYIMIGEFAWVALIFTRNAIQNWKSPVLRNFALILLIPLIVAILSNYQNANATVAILFPIVSSIGLLLTVFLFALNYLSSQPERVSFIVKISGAVLTSMLAIFGIIPWLTTSTYTDLYVPPVMALDHRTLHFSRDGKDGYIVTEVPMHWEDDLGEQAPFPAYNQVVEYDFDFPFMGEEYRKIFISDMGGIGLGETFNEADFQINFTSTPMIIPLLVSKGESNDPARGTYIRIESDKAIITWNKNISCIPYASQGGTYAYQAVLYRDGSYDITFNGLPNMKFLVSNPNAAAWVIGIKPALAPAGTSDFSDLPMKIGPQGALQDEYRNFRIFLHKYLAPIAIAVVSSSLFFLIGITVILQYVLARPLNILLNGVHNFNKGQRKAKIPIQSSDEIGFLTDSFNQLGGELDALINDLEQRVTDRTRELAAANEQLRSEMNARLLAQVEVVEQQRAVATLEERERLARDLHDGIGQVLGFLNVQAQSAYDSIQAGNNETTKQFLTRMIEVAQEAHDDVRGYILGLKKDSQIFPAQDFFPMLEQYCLHLSHNFGFKTRLNLPEKLPSILATNAIETQLFFVIREALNNVSSHSGQKEAEVDLTFDDTYVRVTIEDHGKGFTKPKTGAHFGLEIMRERADQAGGSLEITSIPGVGTRVIVELPRQLSMKSIPGMRVLLVDDHPLFIEGMVNLMAGRGMQVVGTASDGLKAQEKTRELRPDVILMDIEMPICDGLEATRRIKAEMPDVKVVMLTVSGEERHLFDALRSGASGYLLKSLDATEMISLLEELLRGEVSFSPSLSNKMLEAFTRHKTQYPQTPRVRFAQEPEGSQDTDMELTDRQMEILKMVAQGMMYKEIALQLRLAEVTIKYHMGEILARLHLSNRQEAIRHFQNGRLKK